MSKRPTTSFTFRWVALLAGPSALFAFYIDAYALPLSDAVIEGTATVIDGDTIEIGGERLRLEGIDAPELAQSCLRGSGTAWSCGKEASQALKALVAGKMVACDRKGEDKYGRVLAVCFVEGDDINAAMVQSGFARAFIKYSQSYAATEVEARVAGAGIWQGEHVAPWDFRHKRWQSAETTAPEGCAIKGNISRNGHIYHLPWMDWYDKVKIDEERGERWFCSESEALAAGWRAAIVR